MINILTSSKIQTPLLAGAKPIGPTMISYSMECSKTDDGRVYEELLILCNSLFKEEKRKESQAPECSECSPPSCGGAIVNPYICINSG